MDRALSMMEFGRRSLIRQKTQTAKKVIVWLADEFLNFQTYSRLYVNKTLVIFTPDKIGQSIKMRFTCIHAGVEPTIIIS